MHSKFSTNNNKTPFTHPRVRGVFILFCFIFSTFIWADSTDNAQDIQVSISKRNQGEHFISGSFMIEASTASAWNTLTDYEGIHQFVPTIKKSHRINHNLDPIYLHQEMVGHVGFFRKTISLELEIRETPPFSIEFTDVLNKSFTFYSGEWRISPWDNGLAVTYKLYATPNFFAPDFIANGIFLKNVRELLEHVRTEISRRENLNKPS